MIELGKQSLKGVSSHWALVNSSSQGDKQWIVTQAKNKHITNQNDLRCAISLKRH